LLDCIYILHKVYFIICVVFRFEIFIEIIQDRYLLKIIKR
jgi:hypothetical protein